MTLTNPPSDILYRCQGGPLDGEWHCQGDAFACDGRLLGLESGWYRLCASIYVWEPAAPAQT